MSRAQMEIFGLVIIVILVALGLLFAVAVLTKKPTQQVQQMTTSVQGANFLNTLMGTTARDCHGLTVRGLIQDCALADVNWNSASVCADGKSTCERANATISFLLEKTFGEVLKKDYRFFMSGSGAAERISLERGGCPNERESAVRPELVRPGFYINVTLYLCDKTNR